MPQKRNIRKRSLDVIQDRIARIRESVSSRKRPRMDLPLDYDAELGERQGEGIAGLRSHIPTRKSITDKAATMVTEARSSFTSSKERARDYMPSFTTTRAKANSAISHAKTNLTRFAQNFVRWNVSWWTALAARYLKAKTFAKEQAKKTSFTSQGSTPSTAPEPTELATEAAKRESREIFNIVSHEILTGVAFNVRNLVTMANERASKEELKAATERAEQHLEENAEKVQEAFNLVDQKVDPESEDALSNEYFRMAQVATNLATELYERAPAETSPEESFQEYRANWMVGHIAEQILEGKTYFRDFKKPNELVTLNFSSEDREDINRLLKQFSEQSQEGFWEVANDIAAKIVEYDTITLMDEHGRDVEAPELTERSIDVYKLISMQAAAVPEWHLPENATETEAYKIAIDHALTTQEVQQAMWDLAVNVIKANHVAFGIGAKVPPKPAFGGKFWNDVVKYMRAAYNNLPLYVDEYNKANPEEKISFDEAAWHAQKNSAEVQALFGHQGKVNKLLARLQSALANKSETQFTVKEIMSKLQTDETETPSWIRDFLSNAAVATEYGARAVTIDTMGDLTKTLATPWTLGSENIAQNVSTHRRPSH